MPPPGRVESKCMNNGRSRRMRYTMPKTMSPQVGVPDRKVAHRYVEVYPGAHVAAVDDGGLSVHRLHRRTVRALRRLCVHRREAPRRQGVLGVGPGRAHPAGRPHRIHCPAP